MPTTQTSNTPLNANPVNPTQTPQVNPATPPQANPNLASNYSPQGQFAKTGFIAKDGRSYTTQAFANAANARLAMTTQNAQPQPSQQQPQQPQPLPQPSPQQAAPQTPQQMLTNQEIAAGTQQQPQQPQQSQNQTQQQGQSQPTQQQQEPDQSQQPSDNSNLQVPQGSYVHQSSAGNLVPQTSGDDGMISAINQQTGQVEMASPNDPRWQTGALVQNNPSYQLGHTDPSQNAISALQGMNGQDFDSMMSKASSQGVDQTGASLLKSNLMSQLGAIDDPNINKYLDNMSNRANASYSIGLSMVNSGREEIDGAIQGTLVSPSTYEGTQAKILKDTETQQLQTIAAQRQYNQDQNAIQLDGLQTKRANLEGFLKSRMYADGTQDSSAALSVMSQTLHQADMTIAATNSGYTYAQSQLNIQGMKAMSDFGDNISSLVASTNQKQQQITSDYYGQLNTIDQQALSNEKDKRTAQATAFGDYYKGMSDLRSQQITQSYNYAQLAWTEHQGIASNAIAMAGVSGTIWTPDGKGGMKDTGVATMASRQNQFTQWHDTTALQMQQSAQNFGNVSTLIDKAAAQGVSVGSPYWNDFTHAMEQQMGVPQGTYSAIKNPDDLKDAVNQDGIKAQQVQSQLAEANDLKNVPQSVKDVFNVGGVGGQCGTWASTISTAPKVGNTWAEKIGMVHKNGDIQDNPQAGYKMILPLGVNTDGTSGAGHVETVLSYDPNTRNILTVDANHDLKGTIQMHVVNLDQINQKYQKQGWGFLPGQLQPAIQQKLSQAGTSFVQQPTPQQPNIDYLSKFYQETNAGKIIVPPMVMTNLKNSGQLDNFKSSPAFTEYQQYLPQFSKLQGVESQMKTDTDRQGVDAALTNIFQGLATDTTLKSWSENVFDNDVPLANKAQGILQQITAGGKQWTDTDRQKYINMAHQIYDSAQTSFNSERDQNIQSAVATTPGLTKDMANELFPKVIPLQTDQKQSQKTSNSSDWGLFDTGAGGQMNNFNIPSTNYSSTTRSILQKFNVQAPGGGSQSILNQYQIN